MSGIGVHWYIDQFSPLVALDYTHQKFPDKFILATEATVKVVKIGVWSHAQSYASDILDVSSHVDMPVTVACRRGNGYSGVHQLMLHIAVLVVNIHLAEKLDWMSYKMRVSIVYIRFCIKDSCESNKMRRSIRALLANLGSHLDSHHYILDIAHFQKKKPSQNILYPTGRRDQNKD